MDVPELENATKKVAAAPVAAVEKEAHEVGEYEMDLISYIMGHRGLAAQFALFVAFPVGMLCYWIGKHVGH